MRQVSNKLENDLITKPKENQLPSKPEKTVSAAALALGGALFVGNQQL
jgi:hypothetical protein